MFSWFSFLTYAVTTTMTPGPNNIMSMSNASRVGIKKALPFNLGIFVGFSTVMVICTSFCSLLSTYLPFVKIPMLFIGAAYLLYLAWSTLRSTGQIEEKQVRSGFLEGFLLQFVNPKIYIYCIISMEAYILPVYNGRPLILFGFCILLAAIGCTFNILWAGFGTVFKMIFSRHARVINTVMALLLVYCAVALFL